MKHLTIRNVPEPLARRLDETRRAGGRSLNQTVIDLLGRALGLSGERRNGLRELAGAWGPREHAAFERAVAEEERLDAELWR